MNVRIPAGRTTLEGELQIPDQATAAVILAYAYGPRPDEEAARLYELGLATLTVDVSGLDVSALERARRWLAEDSGRRWLKIGLIGEGPAASAVLATAAGRPDGVDCVLLRDARPEDDALEQARCPTFLSVTRRDEALLEANHAALARLSCEKRLETGAGPELEDEWVARRLEARPGPAPWY